MKYSCHFQERQNKMNTSSPGKSRSTKGTPSNSFGNFDADSASEVSSKLPFCASNIMLDRVLILSTWTLLIRVDRILKSHFDCHITFYQTLKRYFLQPCTASYISFWRPFMSRGNLTVPPTIQWKTTRSLRGSNQTSIKFRRFRLACVKLIKTHQFELFQSFHKNSDVKWLFADVNAQT